MTQSSSPFFSSRARLWLAAKWFGLAAVLIVGGKYQYDEFTRFETAGGTIRLTTFMKFLYEVGGKQTVVGFAVVGAAGAIVAGIMALTGRMMKGPGSL